MIYFKLTRRISPQTNYVKVDKDTVYLYYQNWQGWNRYGARGNKTPEDAVVQYFAPSVASFDALYLKELTQEEMALELFQ